jgi:hypothetical protein
MGFMILAAALTRTKPAWFLRCSPHFHENGFLTSFAKEYHRHFSTSI